MPRYDSGNPASFQKRISKSAAQPLFFLASQKEHRLMGSHRAISWRRAARTALVMMVLTASSVQPVRAQIQDGQPPDVQQLQKKLEQMEKQMQDQRDRMEKQIQELQQQISAM